MKAKILVASIALIGMNLPIAHATNGYFSHGYGMKAKGMAGAATAMAQDAMGGANNPASMVWVGNRLDVGIDWFSPKRNASRSGSVGAFGPLDPGRDFSEDSSSTNFFIPEFGFNKMLNPNMSIGVTVYGNGGMNTDYDGGGAIRNMGCLNPMTGAGFNPANPLCGSPAELGVNLEQLIIAPTFAMKINPNHSVGISPLFAYQHFRANGLEGFQPGSSNPANFTNRGHDSSTGWGAKIGWMGNFGNVTLGASYTTELRMSKFDEYAGLFAEQGDFDIPSTFSLGVAFRPTTQWTVALDYQRINYSDVASVSNPSNNPAQFGTNGGPGFGWSDIDVWKLGFAYQMNNALTLRAGWNHGDNPIQARDVSINILAPGVVTDHITFGLTYALSPSSELTVAGMYAPSESVSGASGLGGTDKIEMKQYSLGVSYGMKF